MSAATKRSLTALASGLVFGIGLAASRMTDPNKVLSFLNPLGGWDPSLLLVMASALAVTLIGYRLAIGSVPAFDNKFHLPSKTEADKRLVAGAALFGVGWGIGGFCPGPAVAALGSGSLTVVAFVAALFVGGLVADWATKAW